MKMKRFLAILLVMTIVLCGCEKPDNAIYEAAEGSFNTQVDEK